jgi:hypothetical protein
MPVKYSKLPKIYPNWDFGFKNIPSGNPAFVSTCVLKRLIVFFHFQMEEVQACLQNVVLSAEGKYQTEVKIYKYLHF